MSKLKEKPSALKREHPALQKMKFINFFYVCRSFFPSWIRSGHGSRDPIESGSTALAFGVLPGSIHLVLLLLVEGAIFGGEFPVGFLQAQLLGVNCQHLCLLLLLSMLWISWFANMAFDYLDYVFKERNIIVFTSVRDLAPDVLGPPGSGSGSISQRYGSGSFPSLINMFSGLN